MVQRAFKYHVLGKKWESHRCFSNVSKFCSQTRRKNGQETDFDREKLEFWEGVRGRVYCTRLLRITKEFVCVCVCVNVRMCVCVCVCV